MNSGDRTTCRCTGKTDKTSRVALAVVIGQLKVGHKENGGELCPPAHPWAPCYSQRLVTESKLMLPAA